MKGKKTTVDKKMMNLKRLLNIGNYLFIINFLFRQRDRKAVDMLMAKCKEKANAMKEYFKNRALIEFRVELN